MLLLKLRIKLKNEDKNQNQQVHITYDINKLREKPELLKINITEKEIEELKNGTITTKKLGEARWEQRSDIINKWNMECWKKLNNELNQIQKTKFPIEEKERENQKQVKQTKN